MTNHDDYPQHRPGGNGWSVPGGFFDWIRGAGIRRSDDRWLAGVCGGVAERTGLDPLIIRGIAIVIALLGGPIFLAYAAGWALLPDTAGRIHVERMLRGIFDPAIIAIGVLAVLTFLPFARGIWWQGLPGWWGMPGWLEATLRTGWIIALIAGIAWLVVVLARRMPRREPPRSHADFWMSDAGSRPAQPFPPMPGYDSRHEQARLRHEDAMRRHDERMRVHAERNAERGARWRDRQPSASYVAICLGLAVVAAGLAAVWALQGEWADASAVAVIALSAGLAVLAVATIVAGIRGRESGGLGFFSFVAVIALLFTGVIPSGTQVSMFGGTTWNVANASDDNARYAMFAGGPTVDLREIDGSQGDVELWLAFGGADVLLPEDVPVRVEVSGFITAVDVNDGRDTEFDNDGRGGMFYSTAVENEAAETADSSDITTVRAFIFIGGADIDR